MNPNDVLKNPRFQKWCADRHLVPGGWAWTAWEAARNSALDEAIERCIIEQKDCPWGGICHAADATHLIVMRTFYNNKPEK